MPLQKTEDRIGVLNNGGESRTAFCHAAFCLPACVRLWATGQEQPQGWPVAVAGTPTPALVAHPFLA